MQFLDIIIQDRDVIELRDTTKSNHFAITSNSLYMYNIRKNKESERVVIRFKKIHSLVLKKQQHL